MICVKKKGAFMTKFWEMSFLLFFNRVCSSDYFDSKQNHFNKAMDFWKSVTIYFLRHKLNMTLVSREICTDCVLQIVYTNFVDFNEPWPSGQ